MRHTLTPLLLLLSITVLCAQTPTPTVTPPKSDPKDLKAAAATPPPKGDIWSDLWNEDDATQQNWLVHFQNTDIVQGQPGFRSPYSGQNSLTSDDNLRQTISIDLFLGAHLWPGGELYFNPEYYQGYGFDNSHGLAGFTNPDAFKLGHTEGDVWIPHLFYRQTFGLGGEQEQLSSGGTQLAEKEDISRVTLTVGRFQVTDQFDTNAYANNGNVQFMNWTLFNAGAFDYASDALGSTGGVTVELNQKDWALRWGGFMVDSAQNGVGYDGDILKAWQDDLEFDRRITINKHPGTIRLLGWLTEANSGAYGVTLNNYPGTLDPTLSRKFRFEYGFVLNIDQEITSDLGVFFRASYRDGHTQAWSFTDIDRGISTGFQLMGNPWGRANDVLGLGTFVNGLSNDSKGFFQAGGNGLLIGDGNLNYSPETGLETYYNWQVIKHVQLSLDYQFIANPAYNSDRGPVNVFSARVHAEF